MPASRHLVPLLADELANALLDREGRHRRADSVMFPLAPGTQMILPCAVHAQPGNLAPATR
jgi:hypothetical protein